MTIDVGLIIFVAMIFCICLCAFSSENGRWK